MYSRAGFDRPDGPRGQVIIAPHIASFSRRARILHFETHRGNVNAWCPYCKKDQPDHWISTPPQITIIISCEHCARVRCSLIACFFSVILVYLTLSYLKSTCVMHETLISVKNRLIIHSIHSTFEFSHLLFYLLQHKNVCIDCKPYLILQHRISI